MVQWLSFVALGFDVGLNNIHLKYPHQTPQMSVQKYTLWKQKTDLALLPLFCLVLGLEFLFLLLDASTFGISDLFSYTLDDFLLYLWTKEIQK